MDANRLSDAATSGPAATQAAGLASMLPTWLHPSIPTVVLLVCSNVFMTYAWYFHLKQRGWTLLTAIIISWLIALPEYLLQVPANRMGHISHGGVFTAPQLKIIQEAITLTVFAVFSILVLKEKLRWTDVAAFMLVMAGVTVAMLGKADSHHAAVNTPPGSPPAGNPLPGNGPTTGREPGPPPDAEGASPQAR